MLFPKENPTPSEPAAAAPQQPPAPQQPAPQQPYPQQYVQQPYPPQPYAPQPQAQAPIYLDTNQQGTGIKIPILFGAVIALLGMCIYLYYQLSQVRADLAQTRDSLSNEISKIYAASTETMQANRREQERLEKDLAQARTQAAQLSGQAKIDAEKHAEEIAASLRRAQDEQAKQLSAVNADLSQTKTETSASIAAANAKIEGVNTDVGGVKTDLQKNRADTEKLISQMKSAQGDLGVQSGLIATNAQQLQALRELGERNYTDFRLAKSKKPQKFGDVSLLLKSVDPKHNKFTIELIADDKTTEKKDRNILEPIQFMLSRASQPYEIVVNDIKKDLIAGYISAPKVQQPRGSSGK